MSVLIFALMTFYASVKFVHLISRHNPTISSHKQAFHFDSSEQVDLKESAIRFAFGVEGYLDGEMKDDPRYVKYLIRLLGSKDGIMYERIVSHHVCTADDFDAFGEPSPESVSKIEQYKTG